MVITLFALSGCAIFGSDEAYITGVTVDEIVGAAAIDLISHTVIITVEPMDLSALDPEFRISDKAVLTKPDSIEDGVAAIYTVTAENGSEVKWSVTVNVQYGVSLVVGGEKFVLSFGMMDSSLILQSALDGTAYAVIAENSTGSHGMASDSLEFSGSGRGPDSDILYSYFDFTIAGKTDGIYNNSESTFFDKPNSITYIFNTDFVVTKYGAAGEDFRATFTGAEQAADRSGAALTHGYAKLLVIEEPEA